MPDTKAVSAISRTGDPGELLRGPLYYTIVLFLVTAFLWRESFISILIVSVMCGGDGLADIIGRRLGSSSPLPWNSSKSWPGSLAMFLGGVLTAAGLTYYLSLFGFVALGTDVLIRMAIIAGVATVMESLPINRLIDDNISVPLTVAGLGVLLL